MTPNCQSCNNGNHTHCHDDWCECRGFKHAGSSIVGLARALGVDDDSLKETLSKFDHNQTWLVLLDQVRELNNRDCHGHPVDTAKEDVKVDGDPFKVRARERVEEFIRIDRVNMDVGVDESVTDWGGRVVTYTGRGVLTIEGIIP